MPASSLRGAVNLPSQFQYGSTNSRCAILPRCKHHRWNLAW